MVFWVMFRIFLVKKGTNKGPKRDSKLKKDLIGDKKRDQNLFRCRSSKMFSNILIIIRLVYGKTELIFDYYMAIFI